MMFGIRKTRSSYCHSQGVVVGSNVIYANTTVVFVIILIEQLVFNLKIQMSFDGCSSELVIDIHV